MVRVRPLSFVVGLGLGLAAGAPDPTLATMRERIRAQAVVQPQFVAFWDEEITAVLALVSPNGSTFVDIDYSFQEAAIWPLYNHSKRVEWMADALVTPASAFFNSSALRATMLRLLDFWLLHPAWVNKNWWWNVIGVPISLGVTTTLFGDLLLPNQTAAAAAQLALSNPAGMTACNLVWTCEGQIYRGLLLENATEVEHALNLSFATIAYTPGPAEGLKADGAFFEHGNQLYQGGYGMSYLQGISMLLSWTTGTPFGLSDSDARLTTFAHFALDGSQRMANYGVPPVGSIWGVALWDVSVIGRDISRPYASNWGMQAGLQVMGAGVMPQGYGLTPVLIGGVGGPRADEFVRFAALLNGSASAADGATALLGNRVYYVADYVMHSSASGNYSAHAPVAPGVGWKASVRMASTRTSRCETGNGENLRGMHLSDGALFLYVTGYEYVDAFPSWDWMRLPGTTVLPYATVWTGGGSGTTRFVGGASDGSVGSAVLDVATAGEGLAMRRSVFFFDDLYVVLGANMSSTVPAHTALPAWSTVAQKRLAATGVFTSADGGAAPLPNGTNVTLPSSTTWIWEGGVGYLFPQPRTAQLRVSNLVSTGNWSTIGAETGDTSVGLLTVTLEQGAPIAGASFVYVVVPNVDLAAFASLAAELILPGGLSVVRNDGGAQAVLHGPAQVMQAAVFALDGGAASLDAGVPGWKASVDATGAFIVRASEAGSLNFAAASPTQAGTWTVRLAIDRTVIPGPGGPNATCGGGVFALTFSPPGNGSSATAVCGLQL